jgi:hypothetical protein
MTVPVSAEAGGWRLFRTRGREAEAFCLDRPILRTGPGWPVPPAFDLLGELCLGALQRIPGLTRPPKIGQSGSGEQVRRKELQGNRVKE